MYWNLLFQNLLTNGTCKLELQMLQMHNMYDIGMHVNFSMFPISCMISYFLYAFLSLYIQPFTYFFLYNLDELNLSIVLFGLKIIVLIAGDI